MAKIAIDVVLLPPKEIIEKSIELNRKYADEEQQLHPDDYVPHISLCMGAIKEEDLAKAKDILKQIAKDFSNIHLTAKIRTYTSGNQKDSFEFIFEKNTELQSLHEIIMKRLHPLLPYDITSEMFFQPPPPRDTDIAWVKDYPGNSSFDKFHPHITLGYGIPDLSDNESFTFTASVLAVVQLGKCGTCRKIISSFNPSAHNPQSYP